ncbi:MAG: hypothetical protein Q7T71_15960 [Herbiconiux sp.]|nr:hypothetical protein [Herbiconiux sp.]
MSDPRDMDPNLDEVEYESTAELDPEGDAAFDPSTGTEADPASADEHADNPNPDADGVAP